MIGFVSANAYLGRYPNRPVTLRAAAGVVPARAYCAFSCLVLWTGMDQELHPLQVVGTVFGAVFLIVMMPWLFWLYVKSTIASITKLFGK